MKRIFIILAAAMMAVGAMGQVVESTPRLTCIGNTYYYGRNVMNQRQMLDWYAQQNCQAAYDQFAKGRKMAIAGWCCLGVGVALDLSAGACYLTATWLNKKLNAPKRMLASSSSSNTPTAYTLLAMGATAFEIASVPLLVIGYKRMHQSVDVYNVACTTAQTKPYWTIQASENGLGLALNF